MCRRDVDLAELTGARVHLAHLSTVQSFDALRDAKRRGLPVTGETCPHYWILTDEAVGDYDTNAKMNPPLREPEDVAAVCAAVADGTIDAIATDHAPHHYDAKEREFDDAPFGIIGLETALGLALTELVEPGRLTLPQLLERMSTAPARAFGLAGGTLAKGTPADVVVFDPAARWVVDPARSFSKSRNTPFAGRTLLGRVIRTIVGGRVVFRAEGV
jgi:dihydroorotase